MKNQIKKPTRLKKQAVRHHPFERALTWAQNRLLKAEAERNKASDKLAALDQEIPKLREIIRVHGGKLKSDIGPAVPRNVAYSEQNPGLYEDPVQRERRTGEREVLPDLIQPAGAAPEEDALELMDRRMKEITKR
jgi:hypothetical protein